MKTNRRNFFAQCATLLGLLALPRIPQAKTLPLERVQPEDTMIGHPDIDPAVKWGPGQTHKHWRVPQGRWTFVQDK
jgi:hypothetical protein